MILGLGIDLVDSNRIKKIFNKFGNKFLLKILSEEENMIFGKIEKINKKNNFLAKRFSAKESFLKALGIGLGRGIEFKDISILNNNYGKPEILLSEKAKKIIENLYKIDIIEIKIHVSITDEKNLINVITIISKKGKEDEQFYFWKNE